MTLPMSLPNQGEFEFDATVDNTTGSGKATATPPYSRGLDFEAKREQLKRKHLQHDSAYPGMKIAKLKRSPSSRNRFTPQMDCELRGYMTNRRGQLASHKGGVFP